MNTPIRTSSLLVLLIQIVCLPGCMTVKETFADQDASRVWTAMQAVAQTPDYDSGGPSERWTVRENQVAIIEDERRIEIYRELDRVLERPGAKPLRETRDWKFTVSLDPGPPPTAKFLSRAFGVPAHARLEAERFFADVRDLLASGVEPYVSVDSVEYPEPARTSPVESGGQPIVNPEDLEPRSPR